MKKAPPYLFSLRLSETLRLCVKSPEKETCLKPKALLHF